MTEFQKKYLEKLKEKENEKLANNAGIISSFKEFMVPKHC
jgi:hypothetical protein